MPDSPVPLDRQLWDLVYAHDAAWDRAARTAGLSAAQACLLDALTDGGRSMGELAELLLCDASNVTQLVARLEAGGLVARRADADDRRVKRVTITPAGRRVRRAVRRAFDFADERLGRLTEAERLRLSGLLGKLLAPPS
ncbi:MarR family winged helix-turn-helix transcriptional regulator [Geodermatophilus nigrescens]|uniref:Transcriptional regulator, MarR family n=1 Tax=Geodermatophilus nigrescens TaxID=1070870 RepID=A0A1M5I7A2_9ACTN|nr:MarR family winged helix-turn-helix transcriptional regulator [Geodermatophilus nigrescens]SHG24112.1 transcriptional regulator, MarR family [Geodermatophilus nigrescens]